MHGACPSGGRQDECRLNLKISEWNGTEHMISVELWPVSADASGRELPVAAGMSSGESAIIAAFVLCIALPLLGWIRLLYL